MSKRSFQLPTTTSCKRIAGELEPDPELVGDVAGDVDVIAGEGAVGLQLRPGCVVRVDVDADDAGRADACQQVIA